MSDDIEELKKELTYAKELLEKYLMYVIGDKSISVHLLIEHTKHFLME
jgi:hypothetical protein